MDRKAIVNEIKNFESVSGIPSHDFVVGYGAAAVMHGIRHSVDELDIDVHSEEFEAIACMKTTHKTKNLKGDVVVLGNIEVHTEEHHSDFELIDGVWVVGKKTLLRQYRWLFNHPERTAELKKKDLHVIKALRT